MSDFFDSYFNIKKIMEGKREYKQQMERVAALSEDYRYVFKKIQEYTWMHAGGDGMDMLQIHYDLIDLFEQGDAAGKRVLDITGEDVAAFTDELMRNAKTYTQSWQDKMNRDIAKKVGRRG